MASRRRRVLPFPPPQLRPFVSEIRVVFENAWERTSLSSFLSYFQIPSTRERGASLISIHQSWHFHFSSSLPPPHRRCLDLILRVTSLFPSWKRIFLTLSCDFPLPATATALVTSVLDVRSFPAAENSHITKKHRDIKSPRKYYKGLCLKHLLIYLLGSRLYRHLPLHLPARRSRRLQISSWEKQWWEKTLVSFKHVDVTLLFSGKERIKK